MTLRWVPGWNGLTEPEAVSYVAAVEAADGQELEFGVAKAINDFVLGCKNDGIWDAIKASCILAGARTLNGALVPLKGTAPTNYNFVSGDYDRETGLVGDGSTKYLDSNRGNADDPQDSVHNAVYVSTLPTVPGALISVAGTTQQGVQTLFWGTDSNGLWTRNRSNTLIKVVDSAQFGTGFTGHQRSAPFSYATRTGQVNYPQSSQSQVPYALTMQVFSRSSVEFTDARIAFYSIGESLDLAALDTRVSALITAIGAAIP